MPLIFVHGVSVRKDQDYDKSVNARDALFRQFVLSSDVGVPKNGVILNPYWGDKGAKFYWEHASLPAGSIEALGVEDEDSILLMAESLSQARIVPETVFRDLARNSLKDAVDLIAAASVIQLVEGEAAEWASIASLAINYANDNERPGWLDAVNDDQQFLTRFEQELDAFKLESRPALVGTVEAQEWEALGNRGVWSHFREGMARLRGALGRTTGRIFVDIARPSLHKNISTFIGDVLVYLKERGDAQNPGPIVREIISALDYGKLSRTAPNEKLIVIAHSMGGNIAYDVLTYFRPDIEIDLLVTVGSQVGLFEELKLFIKSDKSVPADPKSDLIEKPSNVGHWINIFDENDILGFAVKHIFTSVSEYEYSTGKGAIAAHSNYFTLPSFHERLNERILEAYR